MKAELEGAVVVKMTMEEARLLRSSLSAVGLNHRGHHDRPTVMLYRALVDMLDGPRGINGVPDWEPLP